MEYGLFWGLFGSIFTSLLWIIGDQIDRRYLKPRIDWDDLQERFTEDIDDSFDMDWVAKDGARMIVERMKEENFEIRMPRDA